MVVIEPAGTARFLRLLYEDALKRCAPDTVLRDAIIEGRLELPRGVTSIVALGKCAVPLASAAAELTGITNGTVVYPAGYGNEQALPDGLERLEGEHPLPSRKSRSAARRVIEVVRQATEPILFIVSGGASACLEDSLEPHVAFDDLVRLNEQLLASGLPIEAVNTVRRHLSSVKGGRLGAMAPPGSLTLVYSDVPPGRPDLVGSGPTAPDPTTLGEAAVILRSLGGPLASGLAEKLESGLIPETPKTLEARLQVVADSNTLVEAVEVECRKRELLPRRGRSLDGRATEVAARLAAEVATLRENEVLVSAGESTVEVRGGGLGGRCTELAARFVLACDDDGRFGAHGVFGSSDGRDGSSPAAAVCVLPATARRLDRDEAAEAFESSASYQLVTAFGEPIIMKPTGNNLRDFVLLLGKVRGQDGGRYPDR